MPERGSVRLSVDSSDDEAEDFGTAPGQRPLPTFLPHIGRRASVASILFTTPLAHGSGGEALEAVLAERRSHVRRIAREHRCEMPSLPIKASPSSRRRREAAEEALLMSRAVRRCRRSQSPDRSARPTAESCPPLYRALGTAGALEGSTAGRPDVPWMAADAVALPSLATSYDYNRWRQ